MNEEQKMKLLTALGYKGIPLDQPQYETLYQIYKRNKAEKEHADAVAHRNNIINNGIDHYYHRKTVYEAAQQGVIPGLLMLQAGHIKEWLDKPKYTEKYGAEYAENESKKDLQNNNLGFILGLNSNLRAEENPEFNKYNSNSMNLLLKALGGNK